MDHSLSREKVPELHSWMVKESTYRDGDCCSGPGAAADISGGGAVAAVAAAVAAAAADRVEGLGAGHGD